ncbi:hypothetical protein [Rufibacter roseus]|uniref:Uncharacterized protein n=1 Tax=Rufibacter roseus TaxID=1567108 RepID=A0ABW2DNP1_9BACT|nr:hypothetical protein [Rufibacter roseus]
MLCWRPVAGVVQDKKKINLGSAPGVAVREYQTDVGPADYVLFVGRKPVGIIESKREEEGLHPTMSGGTRPPDL